MGQETKKPSLDTHSVPAPDAAGREHCAKKRLICSILDITASISENNLFERAWLPTLIIHSGSNNVKNVI